MKRIEVQAAVSTIYGYEGSLFQKTRLAAQTVFQGEMSKIKGRLSTETSEHINFIKKRWFLDYMIKLFLELCKPVAHCCITQY